MAEEPMYSSQDSEYERHRILEDQENVNSSPLTQNRKPKRPPTVTPKRFTKFFTPRASLSSRGGRQSKAGRQLRDITRNGLNRRRISGGKSLLDPEDKHSTATSERPFKRRKRSIDIGSSPPQSSPLKRVQIADEIQIFEDLPSSPAFSEQDASIELPDDFKPFPKQIRRLRQAGAIQSTLQRSFGGRDALGVGRRLPDHCADWRAETADFVSTPDDVHSFRGSALPFCTASCNTNSLVAIGEEEGSVRLIDSSPTSDFTKPHVEFRPHHNAIMDIAFSSDDYMLATASGDQTTRIVDMHTRQTICILSGHTSSVKQVRFQPNDDNILTTSSRDGSVQIWDMRCGGRGSIASLRTAFARNVDNGAVEPTVQYSKHTFQVTPAYRPTKACSSGLTNINGDSGVSITSIQHLPNGREHLLVTASEVNSAIKLWDLRSAGRRNLSTPVSSTNIPQHHANTRNFGINSMLFSSDGARLYTVCRDSRIYAYSTNHLILGCAPEFDSSASKQRLARSTKPSIGPLYSFSHPALWTGSFYVKSSLRLAKHDKSEMLAVGSSNNCAVLFPTDERHLPVRERACQDEDEDEAIDELPALSFAVNSSDKTAHGQVPNYQQGSALVRGHEKEVTSLAWTFDGELVTIGDDLSARCWREDGDKARDLRSSGEGQGLRWMCGWADVDATWDEDEA
jgi:WD40 repeat protein